MSTFLDDDHPLTVAVVSAVIFVLCLFAMLFAGCAKSPLSVVGPAKPIMASYTLPPDAKNCKAPEYLKLSNGRTGIYLQCELHKPRQFCDAFYMLDAETGKVLGKVTFCEDWPRRTHP